MNGRIELKSEKGKGNGMSKKADLSVSPDIHAEMKKEKNRKQKRLALIVAGVLGVCVFWLLYSSYTALQRKNEFEKIYKEMVDAKARENGKKPLNGVRKPRNLSTKKNQINFMY